MAAQATPADPGTAGIDRLDFSSMALDVDQLAELIGERGECVLNWTTRQGHPVGVVIAYLYRENRFWMACTARRKRVAALTARPRCSVVINKDGRSATFKGTAIIHRPGDTDWPNVADWFYPALSGTEQDPHNTFARGLQRFLDTPAQVIIEVRAGLMVSFDFAAFGAMLQAAIEPTIRRLG
jgi:hypothetical protein